MHGGQLDPDTRVAQLIASYGNAGACAAHLLCDRHDADAVAFSIIGPDLVSTDLTYGELKRRSERFASSLGQLGVRPGDRVATLMTKSAELLVSLLAIWRLGAIHVPLFTAFGPAAIDFRLKASRARAVIVDPDQGLKLAELDLDGALVIATRLGVAGAHVWNAVLEGGNADFAAFVGGGRAPLVEIYTSGTTGTPKGVHVPVQALASFQTYLEYGLDVRADDIYWNAADPGWAYGLYYGILAPLVAGRRSLLLTAPFSAELTLDVLERCKVTNFAAAPTVYRALRSSGLNPQSSLRCASSAGEPLTPEVNLWAQEALGVEVHDHYGQTECGMMINNHQHPALRRDLTTGAMGRSMPGWRAVVLDAEADRIAAPDTNGRLAVELPESPLAWFEGYVGAAAKTAEKFSADGRWYLTGDVARTDREGCFYFGSRDDDVIIMAGYRIGPFEVESAMSLHPAILECAAVAIPDEVRGEVLEAVVVLRPGYAPSDGLTQEIQAQVKRGFAAHAFPRRVHYAAALPKTASGKVQRFVIREQLRAGGSVQAS
ncbi:AMP-binding protein [Caulobacter sp. CCNWLY153]|uniref:AMP-dependent synthetase n=1 Tax=Caulobacter radicis TaxID=2172650 RepID=A0A2T9J7G9_9CAUL|nr:AMP-binding protein [Caulobacter radicis]PVM77463.1 AMP-dependent synthetase [Caulobacter radicis]